VDSLNEFEMELINVPGVAKPVFSRKNTTDFETLKYIFYDKEFRLNELTISPKWIIDGGANVGYTSVYFANAYPEARIIAVEPDESNCKVLKENVAPYKQVEMLHSGIWNKDTYLKVKDVGLGEWGMMVEESMRSDPGSFKAVTITSLMKTYNINEIDILKLNIEGAEKELFSDGYEEWLNKVKIIIIELHDTMKPGCSETFFKAVTPYNFAYFRRSWNHILINREYFQ